MKYIGVCFLIIFHEFAMGGFERTQVGAGPAALGNAIIAVEDDGWSLFFNPAGLAGNQSFRISIFAAPSPYGLSELSTTALAVEMPMDIGSFGFGARRYGFDLYREVSGTFCYATVISGVSFGVNCNYHSVSIQNYGSASTVGIDAGIVVHLLQNLTWGLAATNVNAPTIGISREPLPRRFSTGVSYVLANRFTLAFDLLKESGYDVSPRGGCEYRIIDAVALRGGFKNAPSEFSGGIGIRYAALDFDYAYVMNPALGGTQEISISIR